MSSPSNLRRPPRCVPDPLGPSGDASLGWNSLASRPRDEERNCALSAALERLSDAVLLQRCLESDEGAWRILVRRYRNLVFSTALDVGLDADDAGDVFQEVWLELHRSIPRIRNPDALPRWLVVATRRLSYKIAVRRRRSISGVSRDLVDPATLSDEAFLQLRTRQKIEEALDRLDGRCASLLRLLFFQPEKLPYDEVSKRTGLAIGSIGPIRARCLERLRKIMEDNS